MLVVIIFALGVFFTGFMAGFETVAQSNIPDTEFSYSLLPAEARNAGADYFLMDSSAGIAPSMYFDRYTESSKGFLLEEYYIRVGTKYILIQQDYLIPYATNCYPEGMRRQVR